MTDRTALYYALSQLDVDEDLKEVLEMFIDFIDYEDEATHYQSVKVLRNEIDELRGEIYELEDDLEAERMSHTHSKGGVYHGR